MLSSSHFLRLFFFFVSFFYTNVSPKAKEEGKKNNFFQRVFTAGALGDAGQSAGIIIKEMTEG